MPRATAIASRHALPGLGIDGCRGGWCCVRLEADATLAFALHSSLANALAEAPDPQALILLDMPLGLPHQGEPMRLCDRRARQLLGRRGVTVFSPPCREALAARDHAQACRINRRHLDRGISLQAWGIAPRIAECDNLVLERPWLHERLLEAHPELAFTALAGAPLAAAKRSEQGRLQRLTLLEGALPAAPEFVEGVLERTKRKDLAADDLLDATALAWAASLGLRGLVLLPEDQDRRDAMGLPMRIAMPAMAAPAA